jgi:putative transposase
MGQSKCSLWRASFAKSGNLAPQNCVVKESRQDDNAACEGFFGKLKTEMFYSRDWRTTTIDQFIRALDSYIRWYNEKRIKLSLGYLSPIEYRESLGLTT